MIEMVREEPRVDASDDSVINCANYDMTACKNPVA
jgi:hypothetical protein